MPGRFRCARTLDPATSACAWFCLGKFVSRQNNFHANPLVDDCYRPYRGQIPNVNLTED